MKLSITKTVGGGWRFLVVVALGLGWLVWGSRVSLAQGYNFQTFPEENSGDPMGYTQAQIVRTTWWCFRDMARIAPTSRAANINYLCPGMTPMVPPYFPNFPPPDVYYTPWASAVSIATNCGYVPNNVNVNHLTLTLKATV